MDVVSQLAMNVTTYEGFYVYLKIIAVMVHINVGLGSLVSYFQQLEDLCLHGVKRDLDDQLLTPNKRLKEFSNQLLNNY
jgi:hypothetical protein